MKPILGIITFRGPLNNRLYEGLGKHYDGTYQLVYCYVHDIIMV